MLYSYPESGNWVVVERGVQGHKHGFVIAGLPDPALRADRSRNLMEFARTKNRMPCNRLVRNRFSIDLFSRIHGTGNSIYAWPAHPRQHCGKRWLDERG